MTVLCCRFVLFFFNDTATTEIYTLSLHDALPICDIGRPRARRQRGCVRLDGRILVDRKSGSAGMPRPISYAVFWLKKKHTIHSNTNPNDTHHSHPPYHLTMSPSI